MHVYSIALIIINQYYRKKYDKNKDEYMKMSNLLAADEIIHPDLQLKITAFVSADVVVSNFFTAQIQNIEHED